MGRSTEELLRELVQLVQTAKGVPMSASCMVNRARTLALIEEAVASHQTDVESLNAAALEAEATIKRAKAEAESIIDRANQEAARLAGESHVMEVARQQAAELAGATAADAEGLRREADAYVDARIAVFEASLHKTMTQVRTMRERLAARSNLDDTNTQLLPRINSGQLGPS